LPIVEQKFLVHFQGIFRILGGLSYILFIDSPISRGITSDVLRNPFLAESQAMF